ncbi:hypothetical protein EDB19DRAFT_1761245 [Suillus lakei]|nr:hypothetical protein EDB19DRAFT_1761245 [Suillus lakei]
MKFCGYYGYAIYWLPLEFVGLCTLSVLLSDSYRIGGCVREPPAPDSNRDYVSPTIYRNFALLAYTVTLAIGVCSGSNRNVFSKSALHQQVNSRHISSSYRVLLAIIDWFLK